MYTCIGCIMLVVVGFWFFSVKKSFSQTTERARQETAQLQDNFGNSLDQIGQEFDSIKNQFNDFDQLDFSEFETSALQAKENYKQQYINEKLKEATVDKMIDQLNQQLNPDQSQ